MYDIGSKLSSFKVNKQIISVMTIYMQLFNIIYIYIIIYITQNRCTFPGGTVWRARAPDPCADQLPDPDWRGGGPVRDNRLGEP